MPVFSFRLKLLLAMTLVVAAFSVTTMFVTQRQVQTNHDRALRQDFERQIAYFTTLQETRLANVSERCLKLCQNVRVVALLSEPGTDVQNLENLYLTALDELRLLVASVTAESRWAGASGLHRLQATFLRFLDAQGHPITPPESVARQFRFALGERRAKQKLAFVRGALDGPELQQIGYLALAAPTNRPGLARKNPNSAPLRPEEESEENDAPLIQELVVTKVVDPVEGKVLGAFVVGFSLPELVPQPTSGHHPAGKRIEPIQSGVLLGDHVYANPSVIPESLGKLVTQAVAPRIASGQPTSANFDARVEGRPYRVFYELLNPASSFSPAYQVCLYSLEEALRDQRGLRWKILGSGAAALFGALILSVLLSHGLSVPIRELAAGTGEIRRGNLEVRVPVRSRDEIGQLAMSFNEMAIGLVQKEKYRMALNQVADERVAQKLVSGELSLGGDVREVSVLFCDIRGFTALTEKMPPREVIEMVNEHMTALTRVVKEHDGLVDKFVGDLLMALFGAPVSHAHDALNAARCALRMIAERDQLSQTSRHQLRVGIGLATGQVVAGCMGSLDRLNYTVLGERVNLAMRLCSQARESEILIDQETVEKLGGLIVTQAGPALHLKGFAAPVQAYRLLEAQPTPVSV